MRVCWTKNAVDVITKIILLIIIVVIVHAVCLTVSVVSTKRETFPLQQHYTQ